MTTYEVIDPLTSSRWQGDLKNLSRNLKVNALLCSVSKDGARTNLGLILHRDIVLFALQWAKSDKKDPVPEVLKCFELTEKWLEDEDSVTKEEIRDAARSAARATANAAARAAAYAAAATNAHAAYAHAVDAAYAAAANAATYTSQGQMIVDYYTQEMTHESL